VRIQEHSATKIGVKPDEKNARPETVMSAPSERRLITSRTSLFMQGSCKFTCGRTRPVPSSKLPRIQDSKHSEMQVSRCQSSPRCSWPKVAWVWTWPLHHARRTLHCAYQRSHVLLAGTAAGVNERISELSVVIRPPESKLTIADARKHRLSECPACSDSKI